MNDSFVMNNGESKTPVYNSMNGGYFENDDDEENN
jgi:hypothetical protein